MKTFPLLLLCLTLILTNTSTFCQIQIGNDIYGEFGGDYAGISVSLSADGNIIALGAPESSTFIQNPGQARVYEWDGTNWSKLGSNILGAEYDDYFGNSVSLSKDGRRIAIGAPNNNENGESAGQTKVFEFDGNDWLQMGDAINGEAQWYHEGLAVHLSPNGNTLAIGSEILTGGSPGHVRIFEWNNNNWAQKGASIIGEQEGDLSGNDVSLSEDGNRIAISSVYNDDNGPNAGQVRIFEWIDNNWIQVGQDIDGNMYESFGSSLALSYDGNVVIIGLPSKKVNGDYFGAVRIFEWNNDNWEQLGADINGPRIDESFGSDVALSADGRRIAVGNIDAWTFMDGPLGSVRVFEWNEEDWVPAGSDIDGLSNGDIAAFCAISGNGNRLAIGGPRNDDAFGNAGHIRIYENFLVSNSEIEKTEIKFFPNPINGILNISTPDVDAIAILDIYGREIQQIKIQNQTIDMQALSSGIYLITFSHEGVFYTKKIVKL